MMAPCKKLYYAVEAVVYIAYSSGNTPISSRNIAQQQGLPVRYLEQIMQKLVHNGILRGVRGPKGGYVLAKEKNEIELGELCRILTENNIIEDLAPTTPIGNILLRPLWGDLCNAMDAKLKCITIAELCDQAKDHNIQLT